MDRPQLQVGAVTITSEPARARELADFYSRLLGWPIVDESPDGGWAQLRPPDGETGATINIEEDLHRTRCPSYSGSPFANLRIKTSASVISA